ncbi:hypothetical protein KP509_26G066600 [Ceratopteris richardii]|uniref:Uncharacterized protein n=1 Tax=Ceratopteris richardii TaxID=49495 RepID=A0A8T2RMZ3_CERRI|nr:hypothetical protein KP509_26G066600 [Ceratopteris richardii]
MLTMSGSRPQWSDEMHGEYLRWMEACFVRKLFEHHYCDPQVCGRSPTPLLPNGTFHSPGAASNQWRLATAQVYANKNGVLRIRKHVTKSSKVVFHSWRVTRVIVSRYRRRNALLGCRLSIGKTSNISAERQ